MLIIWSWKCSSYSRVCLNERCFFSWKKKGTYRIYTPCLPCRAVSLVIISIVTYSSIHIGFCCTVFQKDSLHCDMSCILGYQDLTWIVWWLHQRVGWKLGKITDNQQQSLAAACVDFYYTELGDTWCVDSIIMIIILMTLNDHSPNGLFKANTNNLKQSCR